MVIGPFPGPQFTLPGFKYGVQAGAEYINANGGLGTSHARVDVIACNSQGSATQEATCLRQAVSEKVVAVVGADFFFPSQGYATLAAANIPLLANVPSTPDQYSSKISFPLFFNHSLFVGVGEAAVKDGCKKTDYVAVDIPIAAADKPPIDAGIKAAGGTPGSSITVPLTATDFAPVVARLQSANADCVIANLTAPAVSALLTTIASNNAHIKVYGTVGVMSPQATAQAPKTFEGTYMAAPFPALTPALDGWSTYLSAVEAVGYKTADAKDANAFDGWLGMIMLQKATATQSTITSQRILNFMRGASSLSLGYGTPTLDFTTPVNSTTYAGIYQTTIFIQQASNGAYKTTSQVDTGPALKAGN
jgi:ABC-type branched-subunit amino acid transport system substrate-binding protein